MSEFVEILNIVAWPLVAVVALWYLASNNGQRFVRSVLKRARRFKAFGVELELAGEEEARRLKADLERSFREYREEVAQEFERQARQFDVNRLLAEVAEKVIEPSMGDRRAYRCTVYVEDIVFENVLFRLVDYYPGGTGQGSTYSTRFGIIGRSWRLGRSEQPEAVPDDPEELITTWGMTREEAASQSSKKWYLTLLLKEQDHDPPVGMLFVDAGKEIPPIAMERLQGDERVASLTKAVCLVMDNMRGKGPYLRLFR